MTNLYAVIIILILQEKRLHLQQSQEYLFDSNVPTLLDVPRYPVSYKELPSIQPFWPYRTFSGFVKSLSTSPNNQASLSTVTISFLCDLWHLLDIGEDYSQPRPCLTGSYSLLFLKGTHLFSPVEGSYFFFFFFFLLRSPFSF